MLDDFINQIEMIKKPCWVWNLFSYKVLKQISRKQESKQSTA